MDFRRARRFRGTFKVKLCPRETRRLLSLVAPQIWRETRRLSAAPIDMIVNRGGKSTCFVVVAGDKLRGTARVQIVPRPRDNTGP